MILDHPHQTAIALPLAAYWRSHNFLVNFLISPHAYWRNVKLDDYANRFDQVIRFTKRPDFVPTLTGALRQIDDILSLKKQIRSLRMAREDVIIGLSSSTFVENSILSCAQRNQRIAIIPAVAYNELTTKPDWSVFKFSRAGWLARYFVQPLTGLERTLRLERREWQRDSLASYGNVLERFERDIGDVYTKIVVLVNLYDEFKVDKRSSKIVFIPYPYLLGLDGTGDWMRPEQSDKKRVVFFGAPLDAFPLDYIECGRLVNECLSYLRRNYGNSHRLVYRPHPQETRDSWNLLDLSQFEVEVDRQMAELYFYERRDIEAVFAVTSTSTRSAGNYGINAYVFFELFGFADTANQHFRGHLGKQPDAFFIKNLNSPPIKYQTRQRLEHARAILRDTIASIIEEP